MLQVVDVTKRFGSTHVLHGVSFNVEPGEILGLLGPNGAGKTTTLRIITGLVKPDTGSVCLNGTVVDRNYIQAHVGYLPDEPFLYPRLTGREFLSFIASIRGIPRKQAEERIASLVDSFDLADALDDFIETYSFGMKRKTALCGSLLHEPSLVVLDEPLNGLDPKSVRRVKDLLGDYARANKSVLLSTHLLDIAQNLCTSVAIINRGSMIVEKRPMGELHGSLEETFLRLTSG